MNAKLRDLRGRATPPLSVRRMAAALDLPAGTYAAYESVRFKKPALPIDLTRRIAAVLSRHGVDSAEVMKLAGLDGGEAEPEARAIEAAVPPVQYVALQVALPSEAALAAMFETLLALVPETATRAEAAQILALRLPSGFAGIGPYAPAQPTGLQPAAAEAPPAHATNLSGRAPPPRS